MRNSFPRLRIFVKMTVTLVVIAVLSAYILAKIYQLTEKPIAAAQNRKELEAISAVVTDFNNDPYAEKMTILSSDKQHKLELYPARLDGNIKSFAIKTFSDNGFGGRINMIVGFYIDGAIKGFRVISDHETPGLGSKIKEARFQNQFDGFDPSRHKFKVRQDGGEIDAVTAATISSRAVIDAIQRALDAYNNFKSGN